MEQCQTFCFNSQIIKRLKCGHTYLIVLKKGTETISIPQFTFATAGTTSYEYKRLEQQSDSLTYYDGWYGTCPETSSDVCETEKLVLGDSNTGFSKAYPEILNVFETS